MSIFDNLKKGVQLFTDAREQMGKVWEPINPVDSVDEIQQQRQQSLLPSETKKIQNKQAVSQGMIPIGSTYVDPLFTGSMKKIVGGVVKEVAPKAASSVFNGFDDLSTHVLEKLRGVGDTSEKFILDTIQNVKGKLGVKQPEQNIYINALFDTVQGGKVNANEFANRVKQDLLPLTRETAGKVQGNSMQHGGGFRYEAISLPPEIRGSVADYSEHIYSSPVKTSAGQTHFGGSQSEGYFGHTRVEDLGPESVPDRSEVDYHKAVDDYNKTGGTRRVIEVQSDLFQKGNFEREKVSVGTIANDERTNEYLRSLYGEKYWNSPAYIADFKKLVGPDRYGDYNHQGIGGIDSFIKASNPKLAEEIISEGATRVAPLTPYENIWHERLIREEVKQAAVDGKTKLQFPTGETAMKIEGLDRGTDTMWWHIESGGGMANREVMADGLEVGQRIARDQDASRWIVTDILGNGKFKAVPAGESSYIGSFASEALENRNYSDASLDAYKEEFDLSGKADTNNPIYKFYESEVGKYLQKKYNATRVTDAQGVEWWEVNVSPEAANQPVKAFGGLAAPVGVQLFKDTKQSGTNDDGSTWDATMPSLFNSFRGKPVEYKRTEAPTKAPEVKTLEGEWKGTNYDPYDPAQNRPDATPENLGIGAVAGIKIDDSMVAVPRKKDGITAMLRLGTVIYVPELDKKFLVADLKASRFNGSQQLDFATSGTKSSINPEYNRNFKNIVVLREGKGKEDTRNYVQSGEWDKEKNTPFNVNN